MADVPWICGWASDFTDIWDTKPTDTYDKTTLSVLLLAVVLGLVAITINSEANTTWDKYTYDFP